jgi:hypothetical protein
VKFAFATHGERFETVERGVPTWYKSEFGMIRKVAGPEGFKKAPVTVLEAVAYGENSNEFVVLAKVDGVEGISLGILHANNTFENVLSDGTNKADLAVRPDGIALYGAMMGGESHLMQIDLTKSGTLPSDLGRGRSARLFTDGFFLAISDKGIVRIDPSREANTILLPNSDAYELSSTLSRDGTTAVVSNTSGKTIFLSITQLEPLQISVEAELEQFLVAPATLVGANYFVVTSGAGHLTVYKDVLETPRLAGVLPIK